MSGDGRTRKTLHSKPRKSDVATFATVILLALWLLQTVFLQRFYNDMAIRSTEKAAEQMAEHASNADLYDVIDETAFAATAAHLGIRHKPIRPRTPRHNGKVERSHREDRKRFLNALSSRLLG